MGYEFTIILNSWVKLYTENEQEGFELAKQIAENCDLVTPECESITDVNIELYEIHCKEERSEVMSLHPRGDR